MLLHVSSSCYNVEPSIVILEPLDAPSSSKDSRNCERAIITAPRLRIVSLVSVVEPAIFLSSVEFLG